MNTTRPPRRRRLARLAPCLAALLLTVGCSTQQWYEGVKASNRVECMRLPPDRQADCLERIETRYEEYRRQRRPAQ